MHRNRLLQRRLAVGASARRNPGDAPGDGFRRRNGTTRTAATTTAIATIPGAISRFYRRTNGLAPSSFLSRAAAPTETPERLFSTELRQRQRQRQQREKAREPAPGVASSDEPTSDWNERVEDFLERTRAVSASHRTLPPGTGAPPPQSEPLAPDAAAETIQLLLDDLLRTTAAAFQLRKGGLSLETERDSDSNNNDNDDNDENNSSAALANAGYDEYGQYLDWRTTELSLSVYSPDATEDKNDNINDNNHNNAGLPDETIDVGLAFALMDRLVELERADDSALLYHTMQWSAHTGCLNPILQLWKQAYSPSDDASSGGAKRTASNPNRGESTPTPSQVLAKLDAYRRDSNVLIPDVRSYNIILDAVATHESAGAGAPRRARNAATRQSIVDADFCRSLWKWMWNEADRDSLVRPDEITLRTMLKATVLADRDLAPERCEALVDEWANRTQPNADPFGRASRPASEDRDGSDGGGGGEPPALRDPKGTLLHSLIHVWAIHDPEIAESYLKESARRYLAGECSLPPDAIAWNRVISAHAIAHNQPKRGLRVLEEFWEFYRRAHGLDDGNAAASSSSSSSPAAAETPATARRKNADNPNDSGTINTRSNSSKLLHATVIARNKEESGVADGAASPAAGNDAARKVFPPNLGSYNALLEGFARQNNAREANKIFERLQGATSVSPDIATYTSAIKANGGDLEKVETLARLCLEAYQHQEARRETSSSHGANDPRSESGGRLVLDRAFFHAWLGACARARTIGEAKAVLKEMKALEVTPNATTYRMLTDVFLSRGDSQGAIEWLLAYAKLEGMSESAIVACTTNLLDWYRRRRNGDGNNSSGEVDSTVLLQILCESNFVTRDESLQQLLLGISASQGRSVLGWLSGKKKPDTSLKLWAIVARAMAQEGSGALEVEDLFRRLREEPAWRDKFDPRFPPVFERDEEALVEELYSSLVVAWCKQGAVDPSVKEERIRYWTEELEAYRDGALSLNLAAQVALVAMHCNAGDPRSAEEYVNGRKLAHENGRIPSPPDTILCNMVLNGWARRNNGSRAASFLERSIEEPDAVSYNTVINAFARQGKPDRAEEWACKLVAAFLENPSESRRPQQATFTVLLAAWRRSKHPFAAERAEKILVQMNELCDRGVLTSKPNAKSYQTVLDAWGKSERWDAAERAEELVRSSGFGANKKLLKKIKDIKSRRRKRNRRAARTEPD